ncbi:MAG: ASCH domain-containing protein, partial [Acetobacteraceae bacterium]|nr:ASCH domain-containing protein [Acetobacteraceae bacterium]
MISAEDLYGIKALTLWQPWASLLVWGDKRLETRSWRTQERGLVLIHAGAAPRQGRRLDTLNAACDQELFRLHLEVRLGLRPHPHSGERDWSGLLPFGAIVGIACLRGCRQTGVSPSVYASWIDELTDQE